MRRRRGSGIFLLTLLWISFPTLPTCGQLLTDSEIDSTIPADAFYTGSDVRILVKGIVAEAHQAIRTAAAEAVKEAIIPIAAELAAERVRSQKWEEAWRAELKGQLVGKVLLFGGATLLVFASGAALGATVF